MDNHKLIEMLESVRACLSNFNKIGVYEKKILEAMLKIDRREFVDDNFKEYAYINDALPTEKGQTISQPSTVARMLQLLELKKGDSVLEVGAGSGWNCALIGFIVSDSGSVYGLEIVDLLVERAKDRVKMLKIKNIRIENKDFMEIDKRKKFDKIIFTAGILPDEEYMILDYAKKYLNNLGVLVCPLRVGHLIILKKKGGRIVRDYTREEYAFVPLVL